MTSPDQCLDLQTMTMRPVVRPAAGDLVITEWMSDPGVIADSVGEYFEVLVKTAVDLNGVTLRAGTTVTKINSNSCVRAAANSFLVFGKNNDPLQNGNLPVLTGTFGGTLTSSSVISVLSVDGGTFDSITANGETAGASVQIKPGFENAIDNDVVTNRCTTPVGVRYGPLGVDGGSTGNRGTPGVANAPCP